MGARPSEPAAIRVWRGAKNMSYKIKNGKVVGGGGEIARMVLVTPYLRLPDFLAKSYRGLLSELVAEADQLQPPYRGEFSQRAAAEHEASHCVVAAREGDAVTSAAIWSTNNGWLGEYVRDQEKVAVDMKSEAFLAHLRITLAGRRGELLFQGNKFCLRAGLEELAYALITVMVPVAVHDGDRNAYYHSLWGTLLSEVDETLLTYKAVVHDIADELMRCGALQSGKLSPALAVITKRNGPPPLRSEIKLSADDPLA